MKVVFATQLLDADDPHLGQTLDMVAALARRCEQVLVLCDHVGRHALPENVTIRTFGAPGKALRAVRFEEALLRSRRPDAFLAHMVPRFLVLAAPVYRWRGVPLLLWYTHWNASRELRLATSLADAVLSVHRDSFPLKTPKTHAIGHAIDLLRFEPREAALEQEGPLRLLALGRTEPRKQLGTLLDAVELGAQSGLELRVEIRGPQITDRERWHRDELARRVAASSVLAERVTLKPGVSRDEVPALIRAADVVVSLTRGETAGGALDKVVYEAAACAVPVIAGNRNFEDLLGALPIPLLLPAPSARDLVDVLSTLRQLPAAARTELGRELRRRVELRHSADAWANSVLSVAEELAGGK